MYPYYVGIRTASSTWTLEGCWTREQAVTRMTQLASQHDYVAVFHTQTALRDKGAPLSATSAS